MAKSIILHDHEARAAAQGKLGLIVRPVWPQPRHRIIRAVQERVGEPCKFYDADGINPGVEVKPPFRPGDVLACKEKFSELIGFDLCSKEVPDTIPPCWYWADGEPTWGDWGPIKSPAVMPTDYPRLRLVVKAVSVGRVQGLTEDEAEAAGINAKPQRARDWFMDGWDARHARRPGLSWSDNPVVWMARVESLKEGEKG